MEEQGKLTAEECGLALAIARKTLRIALKEDRVPEETELGVPEEGVFREKRAAFVTLKKSGALRGCIGHILPVEPLWKSIRNNAIAAAIHDNRFKPVSALEEPELHLDISVLTVPTPIADYTGFIPGPHGIIMELSGRRAVFLPQVAVEQGWDGPTTLSYLSVKAGLPPDAWRNPGAKFSIFEAQVFEE